MNSIRQDLTDLFKAFVWYSKKKLTDLAHRFESFKNFVVDVLMYRRGARQKFVWHASMVILASMGVLASGVFGGKTLVSSTYPGVGGADPRFVDSFEPFPNGLILDNPQDTHTNIAVKPRSEVIDYTVESGDTISSIAQKFGISQDTIKWANNLTNVNSVRPGDTLKILPVAGVSVTVKSGETVQSLAKKYQVDAQAIVDFPFNDVPDDFSLKAGQSLIIPDGTPPEIAAPKPKPQPAFLAQGAAAQTFTAPGGANFIWPTHGIITQYFAWYHPGDDIANAAAPVIAASDGGRVVVAGWPDNYGYGNRVVIDHGNGYQSLYAHLSNIYVGVGQVVSRGQVIGQMGSTGRSTGTHLHFEIHYKGASLNPLSILR
ncbi:MAG: M23 family metallopeptidase [Candidatus Daviesbacteria bacterium]|nr:M23 family metallopeptidase [Candidatus Daviesbacteria bacterium]